MSAISSNYTASIPVGSLGPALRLADVMQEAQSLPAKTTDFGNGVVIEQRGNFFKMTGSATLSPRASVAAFEAARMGGEAGQAIFDTYRKHNSEEFDPNGAWTALMSGKMPPPPSAPSTSSSGATAAPSSAQVVHVADDQTFEAEPDKAVNLHGGNRVTVSGSAQDDFMDVLYNSTAYGLGGRDRMSGRAGSVLDGGDGDDILTGSEGATLIGGAGNDVLKGDDSSVQDGGDGDDILSAYKESTLSGGAGDDILSAYENSTLDGGNGNDILSTYENSSLDGGGGDDLLSAYENARISDAGGDNQISAYGNARVVTGAGNDRIETYISSQVDAGDGFNYVTAGQQSSVTTGRDADMVTVGSASWVNSGGGDDLVKVGRGSDVVTGAGDDRLTVDGETTIQFNRGDGNDIIGGGEWGQAYTDTDHLSSSILSFGVDITPADLSMQRQGNDLVIQIGSDSITLKDVQRHGIPTMTFTDGSVLGGDQVAGAVGPAEPYQPASQVMQRWYDACAAYRAQQQAAGNSTASVVVD